MKQRSMKLSAHAVSELLRRPAAVGEAAQLAGIVIDDPLIIENADVAGFDLSNAVFHSRVVFKEVNFTGLSWFKGCTFKSGAEFSGSSFANDARFDGAVFHREFSLARAEVLGASDFNGCVFHGHAVLDHSTFFGSLSFEAAGFHGKASLRKVTCLGGLWSERALFANLIDVTGMDVHGRTWLRNLRFSGQPGAGGKPPLAQLINSYGYQWT